MRVGNLTLDTSNVSTDQYGASYWEVAGGGKGAPARVTPKVNSACFAGMGVPQRVIYIAPINNLNDQQVRFYLRLLRQVLTDLEWTAERVTPNLRGRANHPSVVFDLRCKGSPRPKTLLYLTAFRYINETSHVVRTLYDQRAKASDLEALFKLFQSVHYGRHESGHGLIARSSYYGGSSASASSPVSIARFQDNLKKDRAKSVHSHFS